jgi:hypothetical protein
MQAGIRPFVVHSQADFYIKGFTRLELLVDDHPVLACVLVPMQFHVSSAVSPAGSFC